MDRIFKFDKHQGITMGWHGKTEVKEVLTLDENCLCEWDLVPVPMEKRGKPSKWRILECSDLGDQLEIGAPYNPETFSPITNAAFIGMVRASISGTPHKVVSVGSVRNRGRVFISIELVGMEKFKAAGREFSAYLNFGNGHDKSSVLWVNTGNVCTVCDNTFSFNLFSVVENNTGTQKEENTDTNIRVCQRHTKNIDLKLPAISVLVDKAVGVQAEFALEFDKLSCVPCSKALATDTFAGFVGRQIPIIKPEDRDEEHKQKGLSTRAKNTVNRLVDLFASGKGNRGQDFADVFSAATDFYSHESSGGSDVFKQILSSEYGAGVQAKQDFWTRIREPEGRDLLISRGQTLLAATE